ncbi:N-ethylammeline chlorohydrolase [Alcanivorax sp. P2S70]|uniref:5-methylthioadenosine/S-adenosylhomocysteine deaminase n=1 Tax=Alcanivorax profundi TaxID=2338368 RepID=A0A418Y1R0_9GAMM|nr:MULTISPECIES: TRZ/ATZ family hydrolase [Alcanivorax]ERP86782.1 N-ethylammeline chlorohydrolase [Alcanivorax sp. P2S70]MED5433081.1 TRZ/ATZ family hydrolase [Pseudomonadota bacterium]MEE2869182.1 TRZ/ATZ family hydrolase [Pseudomonadota bacterium]RJG19445.1 TRZ/ATZ family hydrolase [Alcanivorax profundi]
MSDHQADLIVHARWIATVSADNTVLENHALVVRDGRIADLLPSALADEKWHSDEIVRLDDHLLTPGLVNAHTHAAMNLLRGIADDLPLMTWLEKHIWPAEGQFVSEQFVYDGTKLAAAEMIRSGTTTFADMYFFPASAAKATVEAGLRASLFCPLLDFPTPMGAGPEDYLRLATDAMDEWRHDPRIQIGFGPHAPYTVSDAPLQKVLTLAEELDVPVMMHVHETAGEIQMAVGNTGERPLTRLQGLGLLSPRLLAVHMTQLTDEEITLVAETGTHVVHCPESNLKLASGFAPVEKLRQAGINVALGTDGAASNNDLDMIGEARTAAFLAKGVSLEADALPAADVLKMATLNGAKALGRDEDIGSLEIGKQADMVAIDLNRLETQPVYDPVAQLVYAATRDQVTHSWVGGRCLMNHRQLTTLNEALILKNAQQWQQTIAGAEK